MTGIKLVILHWALLVNYTLPISFCNSTVVIVVVVPIEAIENLYMITTPPSTTYRLQQYDLAQRNNPRLYAQFTKRAQSFDMLMQGPYIQDVSQEPITSNRFTYKINMNREVMALYTVSEFGVFLM